MGNIDVAEQSIQKILDATGVISDNITHLSATGEEGSSFFHRGSPHGRHYSGEDVQL